VNECGEAAGRRRARGRFLLVLALLLPAAAGAAACGGSSSSDIRPYLGVWQRVEGGAPNPDVTLTVARQDDGGTVTFAGLANGQDRTVVATAEDGYLACSLPTGDDPQLSGAGQGSPSPGASLPPAESDLQLSPDENGRLVVDLVLPDGTLEPIWIYDRAPPSPQAEP
jgi:hypothetical protein